VNRPVQGSHQAGIDLSLYCMGGNAYMVTFIQYRDCSGIPAPVAVLIEFSCSASQSLNFSQLIQPLPGTGQEITSSCSALPTTCNGGILYGIQQYVYQGVVILPPCNFWTIS
jgi:hypothetical protein